MPNLTKRKSQGHRKVVLPVNLGDQRAKAAATAKAAAKAAAKAEAAKAAATAREEAEALDRGYGGRGLLARTGKGRGKGKVKGKGNKRPTPKKTRHLTTDRAIAVIRSHVREAKKLAKQHQLKVTFAFAKSADGYDDDDDSGYDDDYGDYGI